MKKSLSVLRTMHQRFRNTNPGRRLALAASMYTLGATLAAFPAVDRPLVQHVGDQKRQLDLARDSALYIASKVLNPSPTVRFSQQGPMNESDVTLWTERLQAAGLAGALAGGLVFTATKTDEHRDRTRQRKP